MLRFNLGLLIIIFSACKPEPLPFIAIPEEVKAYIDFKEGSYWVYEQLGNPDNTDSLYVYANRSEILPVEDISYEHESEVSYYHVLYYHNNWQDTIDYAFYLSPEIINQVRRYVSLEMTIKNIGLFYQEVFYYKNFEDPENFSCRLQMGEVQDSLRVGKQVYINTITTSPPESGEYCYEGQPGYIVSETYAPHIGVVRRQYGDGTVYELVRYHINQ